MKKIIFLLFLFNAFFIQSYAQWHQTNMSIGQGIISVLTVSDSNVYIVHKDSGIYASKDKSENWSKINNPMPSACQNCFPTNISLLGSNIFASWYQFVFHSINEGETWKRVIGASDDYEVGMLTNDNKIYVCREYQGLFYSSDTAKTWKNIISLYTYPNFYKTNSFAIDRNNIIVGSYNGIYKTHDFGATSIKITSARMSKLAIYEDKIIGTNGVYFYISLDNGQTWATVPCNIDNITSFFANESILYLSSSTKGVYISKDFGFNWTSVNHNLTDTNVYSMNVNKSDIYIGTNNGVWRRPKSEVVAIESIEKYDEVLIYPNPTSDFFILNNEIGTDLILNIYNISGALIKTEKIKEKNQKIDIENFKDGIYIVEMNANNFTKKQKLIIKK